MSQAEFDLNKLKDFNLSDKDFCWCCSGNLKMHERVIKTSDVKEFIKRIKEEVLINNLSMKRRLEKLDKLAGDKFK